MASPPTPSSSSDKGSDDKDTHTTHTFNVPYYKQGEPRREKPVITPIPKITPPKPESEEKLSLEELAEGLVGKTIDEVGNVLDSDGTVLGRVEGDLPSMIGRPVTESGEVLDTEGEVVGWVSENLALKNLRHLDNGLRVDDEGNIYNKEGDIVGHMKDDKGKGKERSKTGNKGRDDCERCNDPVKASAPRPDEVYLDVKSTYDGIQLIIKIPTVFNREQREGPREPEHEHEHQHGE